MKAAVRLYAGDDVFRAIAARTQIGLAPKLARMPGFRQYTIICCDGHVGLGVLLFDTDRQLEAGMEAAGAWANHHLTDLLPAARAGELLRGQAIVGLMRPDPRREFGFPAMDWKDAY